MVNARNTALAARTCDGPSANPDARTLLHYITLTPVTAPSTARSVPPHHQALDAGQQAVHSVQAGLARHATCHATRRPSAGGLPMTSPRGGTPHSAAAAHTARAAQRRRPTPAAADAADPHAAADQGRRASGGDAATTKSGGGGGGGGSSWWKGRHDMQARGGQLGVVSHVAHRHTQVASTGQFRAGGCARGRAHTREEEVDTRSPQAPLVGPLCHAETHAQTVIGGGGGRNQHAHPQGAAHTHGTPHAAPQLHIWVGLALQRDSHVQCALQRRLDQWAVRLQAEQLPAKVLQVRHQLKTAGCATTPPKDSTANNPELRWAETAANKGSAPRKNTTHTASRGGPGGRSGVRAAMALWKQGTASSTSPSLASTSPSRFHVEATRASHSP
jgi:hypothetical protein